ncbi:DNA-directed RNA polymerase subunit alpha C-terminal domain-containing protein [Paenibacillus sp. NPDC093718]|uniref:DNA-directed RNA polymerase subunit alpha C-terminal domain-containing protein n=1 Tax=Paenibacillus sp. NPDC093718 TaxID=3390601 RepID=UPI003CFF120B
MGELDYLIDSLNKNNEDPNYHILYPKVEEARQRVLLNEESSTNWFFLAKNDSKPLMELVTLPQHIQEKSIQELVELSPDTHINTRISNALHRMGCTSVAELLQKTPYDLRFVRNFGVGSQKHFAELLWNLQVKNRTK